jgi:predicted thioesterase
MTDEGGLRAGLSGTAGLVVGEEHTAAGIGSGRIRVLGTPVMINLMEAAALAAAERFLPEGHQSLGIELEVSHVAATPVGMAVEARAEVTRVEGNRIEFRIEAHDEIDLIGKAEHARIVVDVERFDRRVRKKAASLAGGGRVDRKADFH